MPPQIIQKAEKNFALELPLLVNGTARDVKILSAISAMETDQIGKIFYQYRPHRSHLTTRFGLLFYNDKITSPEAMRTSIIAMLHHGHAAADKMGKAAEAFWWPGMYREIQKSRKFAPASEPHVRTSQHKYRVRR